MGKKSRTKWERRRAALLALPGTLGYVTRAIIGSGETGATREAWRLRDQHLRHGKSKAARFYYGNGTSNFPRFLSVAAMMENLRAGAKT